ncbi:MAG: PA2169 family four-helix-bundle protein [Bacteroidota bacterium]|nr:PA2169 family four-helix-bundle protein [Bacteroidota bacterium]
MDNSNTSKEGLKDISELLIDSRKGYQEAAERVEAPHLKQLLSRLGTERAPLINEVGSQLRMLGEDDLPKDGTIKGSLHRTWIDIRDSLTGSENANVLDECERGEKYLLGRYDDLMKDGDIAPNVRSMLSMQRTKIQGNINEIQALHATHEASEKNK